MQFIPIGLLFGVLWLAACDGSEHGRPAPPLPAPVAVKPFAIGSPDAVLLVTGSTHGMLEVCNCSGPMPGGLARRSGLVLSYRHAFPGRTVLVDTGDVFWLDPDDIRNRYVLSGYRQMGYDAVTLADHEWAADNDALQRLLMAGETAWLSTTIQPKDASLPLAKILRRQFGEAKLAVISDILPDAFLFFDGDRRDELAFTPHKALLDLIGQLKGEGRAVIAVLHGSDSDMQAAADLPVDVILRGHVQKSSAELLDIGGKPEVKVGGSEHVGVLGLRISPDGRVTGAEYRMEVVDDSWPLDKRMLELYQAYAHEAMRLALDAERKQTFEMIPSEQCGRCHRYQYETWKKSQHAHAYTSLQRVGRTGDPNCVGCHTLGFGMEGGFYTFERTPEFAGVHCQNCHRFSYAEHREEGFVHPRVTEEVCTSCHTPVTDPKFGEKMKQRFRDMGCGPTPESFHQPMPAAD